MRHAKLVQSLVSTQWLLIRDNFTGCLLGRFLSLSSSERTHITKTIWFDWAGRGAASRACTAWPGITSETASSLALPRAPPHTFKQGLRLAQRPRKGSGPLRLKKKAAAKKQAININVPGKGEERKDTGAQKEWLHMALMCSFPQDGSSAENT